jgi:hypothetical protein
VTLYGHGLSSVPAGKEHFTVEKGLSFPGEIRYTTARQDTTVSWLPSIGSAMKTHLNLVDAKNLEVLARFLGTFEAAHALR